MLAAFALITTGLFFGLFAATFEKIVIKKTRLPFLAFSSAYYCLALALLVWGVAAASGNQQFLNFSIIAGDALILAGTIFLASIVVPVKWHNEFYFASAAATAFLIAARAVVVTPQPYLDNGLLIFNSQPVVMAAIGLALAFVWLPVSAIVAKAVTSAVKQPELGLMFTTIYTAATISSLIFISAREPLVIIASFIAISVSFVLLLSSNILIWSLTKGGEHVK